MEQLLILLQHTFWKEVFLLVISILLVHFFIKKLIHISHCKHIFDEPSEARKIHKTKTPNLGGVAIAGTIILVACLFINTAFVPSFQYAFFSLLILLITGVYDDLLGISALKKLAMQMIAACVVVFFGYRFTGFYNFLGWHEMSYWISILTSVFFITFVINAFNLIDGINCLAGSIGWLASACFAFYFRQTGDTTFELLAVVLCGCLTGFLRFNKTPAKIFMGDTGAMLIGFLVSLFSIRLLNESQSASSVVTTPQIVNIVAALLFIPVYDTVRVFTLRIAFSKPPFKADRNHIHHRLIDLGLSHMQATGLLIAINLLLIIVALCMQPLRPEFFVVASFILLTVFNGTISLLHIRKQKALLKKIVTQEPEPAIRVIVSEKRIVNV